MIFHSVVVIYSSRRRAERGMKNEGDVEGMAYMKTATPPSANGISPGHVCAAHTCVLYYIHVYTLAEGL